jgi:CRISPR-associated endoribonuclease Cas6
MRLYIIADRGDDTRFHLPWDYHLSFQAFIYDALDTHEPALGNDLHTSNHAPPFSYSEFIQTGPYDTDKTGLACESGFWVVNSDDARVIDAIANHARGSQLKLGHTLVPVEGVEMEQIEAVETARYRTVSPIFVSIQRRGQQEGLLPDDPMWTVRVRDSVKGRMEARDYSTADFEFDLRYIHNWKEDSMRVNSDYVRTCTYGEFTLKADPVTSRFIQRHGIGEGTGMGMSCVMPVSHIPESNRET